MGRARRGVAIPKRQVFVGCLVDADRRSAHRTGLLKATPTVVRNGWASGSPIDYAARGDQRRDVVVTVLDWQYTYVRFRSVAGEPVAVRPWGNHLALFATDASGVVMCAAVTRKTASWNPGDPSPMALS